MFFHSNNVLIGFDNNAFDGKLNDFTFLNLIQSISFTSTIETQREKFIGSDVSLRDQFSRPEINFSISYIQRVDFFNEFLFGFNIYSKDSDKFSIFKKYENGFLNENVFVILNSDSGDLISKVLTSQNFDKNFKAISFGRVFLKSYSLEYSVGKLPIVEASFSAFNTSTSLIESRVSEYENYSNALFYGFENWKGDFYKTDFIKVKEAIDSLNENQNESIVYQMKNFSLSSDYAEDDLKLPNLNFNTLLDGVIQSINLNIEFNNVKYDFFEKKYCDYKSSYPIKGLIKISGISSSLIDGDLNDIFVKTKLFNMTLGLGKNEIDKDYYEILIENLSIENFTYSIEIGGRLIYEINCYFEISEKGGLSIKQIRKTNTSPISSDSDFLVSNDGNSISTYPESVVKKLPQITKNLDNCLIVKQSANRCLCLNAIDEENNLLCYSWYCNGSLIYENVQQNYLFFDHDSCINGYYHAVISNCRNDRVKTTTSLVVAECKPPIITDKQEKEYCLFSGGKIDLFASALANNPSAITYSWYKKGELNFNCCFGLGLIAKQYDGYFDNNVSWFQSANKKPIIESFSLQDAGTLFVNKTFTLKNLEPSLSSNITHVNNQENLQIQYKNSNYYILYNAPLKTLTMPYSFDVYYYLGAEFKSGITLYKDKELKTIANNLYLPESNKGYLYETNELGILSIKFIHSFIRQNMSTEGGSTWSLQYIYYVGDNTEYETNQKPIQKFEDVNGKKLYFDSTLNINAPNSLSYITTNEDVNIYENSPEKAWYIDTKYRDSYFQSKKADWLVETDSNGIAYLNRIEKFTINIGSTSIKSLTYGSVDDVSQELPDLEVGRFIFLEDYHVKLVPDDLDYRARKNLVAGGLYSYSPNTLLPNYNGAIIKTNEKGMITFYDLQIQFNTLVESQNVTINRFDTFFAGNFAYIGNLSNNLTVMYLIDFSGSLSLGSNLQWEDSTNYYKTNQDAIVQIFSKASLQNFNILTVFGDRFAYNGELTSNLTVLYYLDGVNIASNLTFSDDSNYYDTDENGIIIIKPKVEILLTEEP